MPVTRIAIDGLWRCLCPAIDAIALSQLRTSIQQAIPRSGINDKILRRGAQFDHRLSTRSIHTPTARDDSRWRARPALSQKTLKYPLRVNRAPAPQDPVHAALSHPNSGFRSLDDVPIDQLHDMLRQIRTDEDAYKKTAELVQHLVEKRGEKPSLLHYDSLIRANSDAALGSAEVVGTLLQEMKEDGIAPDSGLYHSVLQALANHPDYILRSEILQEMKDQWFSLTSEGWHNFIIGLLRDRQYEIALNRLEQMEQDAIRIHPWLYDIVIYVLCEAEELDQALKLLKYRVDRGELDISPNVWYSMLDACSKNYHYEGVLYVWRKRVEMSYLNPSDGTCTNVIHTAARHHDVSLATDVVRVLAHRTAKLDLHHYESLLDIYICNGDLKTALRILCIMKKADLEPIEASTRPLFMYLSSSLQAAGDRPAAALKILKTLHKEGKPIPIAAINVILESLVALSRLPEAISQFKTLRTLSTSGPNTATFNTLLQGCAKSSGNKHIAMDLATEMKLCHVRPDTLTYDRLILVCLAEDDYGDAFRYLEEMTSVFSASGEGPRVGTWTAMIRKCAEVGDRRAWDLLKQMEERGLATTKLGKWLEESWDGGKDRSLKAWKDDGAEVGGEGGA